MGKYLVVGRAGSGKSAVTQEMTERGIVAFDADEVSGLSSWQDRKTGNTVKFEDNSYVDLDRFAWLWNSNVVRELQRENPEMFLCGGAENDLDFIRQFDRTFVLHASPNIQTQRIQQRSDNEYGKDPRMTARILTGAEEHYLRSRSLGAIVIDADQPIHSVVDQILANT